MSWLIAAALWCSAAVAEDFGWLGADGKPVPDTESRKTVNNFAGWLLTTSDPDWEAKWNTPEHATPSFTEAGSVRKGETVYTLIFLANPRPGSNGEVNVRCDLKVTRPTGTLSIDEKDVECLKGVLPGSPFSMRLAAPVLGFVGEAADPIGTWKIDVTLRDVVRGVTMELHTSFELVGDVMPETRPQ